MSSLPPAPSLPLTCGGCGACCATQGLPPGYTVPALMAGLPADLRDELLAHLDEERRSRSSRHERGLPCLWYDEETRACRHYEHRPAVCRRLEIATDGCNAWRVSIGLPVFVVERPRALVVELAPEEAAPEEAAPEEEPVPGSPTPGEPALDELAAEVQALVEDAPGASDGAAG